MQYHHAIKPVKSSSTPLVPTWPEDSSNEASFAVIFNDIVDSIGASASFLVLLEKEGIEHLLFDQPFYFPSHCYKKHESQKGCERLDRPMAYYEGHCTSFTLYYKDLVDTAIDDMEYVEYLSHHALTKLFTGVTQLGEVLLGKKKPEEIRGDPCVGVLLMKAKEVSDTLAAAGLHW